MSPQVSNFVHDLITMAQATERLPSLELEVEDLRRQRDAAQAHSQGLELSIIRYKEEIEGLNGRVHAAEVARDDAEYRFLEVDEKSNKVLSLLASISSDANAARVILDPPKAEPEVVKEEVKEQVDPTANSLYGNEFPNVTSVSHTDTAVPQTIGEVSHDTQGDTHQPQEQAPQRHEGLWDGPKEEPKGPYASHNYYDHAVYVSRSDWLEGGGTNESYDWRPASIKPVSSY